MSSIEKFLREPTLERLGKLKEDEMIEVEKNLELEVRGAMSWAQLNRIIVEHVLIDHVFDEEAFQGISNSATVSPAQIEIEKARIMVRIELETARIEQETRIRELNIIYQTKDSEKQRFDRTKKLRFVPKFEENEFYDYFSHCEKTEQFCSMLLRHSDNHSDNRPVRNKSHLLRIELISLLSRLI